MVRPLPSHWIRLLLRSELIPVAIRRDHSVDGCTGRDYREGHHQIRRDLSRSPRCR
jgi:hypothetical protein